MIDSVLNSASQLSHCFVTGYLIEALMLADPLKEQETLVYGLGTVKLLASSPVLRDEIMSADVMVLIEDTLRVCCEACSSSQPTAAEMTHMRNVLIQVCISGKGSFIIDYN